MAFYRLEQCRKEQLRRKQSKQRKRELFNSLQENDDVEEQRLNETVNSVNKSQEAIFIIHRYEDIIKTPNKKARRTFKKVQRSCWSKQINNIF